MVDFEHRVEYPVKSPMQPVHQAVSESLCSTPRIWDGMACILKMRDANCRNWKQMEWIGWFFQFVCESKLQSVFTMPSCLNPTENVSFDGSTSTMNYDFKAHAWIVSGGKKQNSIILNDKEAMDASVLKYGQHGLLLALLECEYDQDGKFKAWHDSLKGEASDYVKEGIQKKRPSRKRKVNAKVIKYVMLTVNPDNIGKLRLHKQGKNSDGRPRKAKYLLQLNNLEDFLPVEF